VQACERTCTVCIHGAKWLSEAMAARVVISVLLRVVLCALLCATTSYAGPNYTEALLKESQNNPEYCCQTPLDLHSQFPRLTHAMSATILSRLTFVGPESLDSQQISGSLQRCKCTSGDESSLDVRLGMWRKAPFRYTNEAYAEQDCVTTFDDPVVLIPVVHPADHFGHQMLTIIPALTTVKIFLETRGLDITRFRVVFVHVTGRPSPLNPNANSVLLALGFSNTTTLEKPPSKQTSPPLIACDTCSNAHLVGKRVLLRVIDNLASLLGRQVLATSRYAFAKHLWSVMDGMGSITRTKMESTTAITPGRESCTIPTQ
jgi:hypothetical protein